MIVSNLSQQTQYMLSAIRNLPILIDMDTENIRDRFVSERKEIRTGAQLKAFTKRWVSVWKIPWFRDWQPLICEKQIVAGRYNETRILNCISKNGSNGKGCVHIRKGKKCASYDIMAPQFLIRLMQLHNNFMVTDGIILLQLCRALCDDLEDLNPDDFFDYVNEGKTLKDDEQ